MSYTQRRIFLIPLSMLILFACSQILIQQRHLTEKNRLATHLTTTGLLLNNFLPHQNPTATRSETQKRLTAISLAAKLSKACFFDFNQDLIASYPHDLKNSITHCPLRKNTTDLTIFTDQAILFYHTIQKSDQSYGQLVLTMSLAPLKAQTLAYTQMALGIILLLGLIAYGAYWRLQKNLILPIKQLTTLIHKATTQQQYQLQANSNHSNPDLAQLANSINDMLQQAQQHMQRVDDFNQKLARSNQELEEFSYIASHDLKAPLRGLTNYALFLSEDYASQLDTTANNYLDRIQSLCHQMDTLINSLLHYSRVGNRELAMQTIDLNQLLKNTQDLLQEFIQEHNATIQVSSTLPAILCDESLISEVFNNLITNGIKYNKTPKKRLEIGTLDDSPNTFYVRDNGMGIAAEHHQKIFQIFQRLHPKSDSVGGSGAGLTIVKKIIARHDGEIWLESALDEGTTFYFTLKASTKGHDTAP
jgi:signal transduction histidine kinase